MAKKYGKKARAGDAGPIVPGTQLAGAEEAEIEHQTNRAAAESPMPRQAYDYWRGDTDLVDPVQLPLDGRIASLCRKFAKADAPARQALRADISMVEFYTLLTFAERAAVFALRKRSAAWLTDGLTAVAIIEEKRVEWRDILMALSFLHHAAVRAGFKPNAGFRAAARLAEHGTKELILGFSKRPAAEKRIDVHWGYQEIETENGAGFIRGGSARSTSRIAPIAFDVAACFAKDKYHPEIELDTRIPRVWLGLPEDAALDKIMAKCREGAIVDLKLRPEWHPQPFSQHVCVFLEELNSPDAARWMVEFAEKRLQSAERRKSRWYCAIALAEGNVFCLFVARSWQEDVASFETPQSMERFRKPLLRVLRRHAGR